METIIKVLEILLAIFAGGFLLALITQFLCNRPKARKRYQEATVEYIKGWRKDKPRPEDFIWLLALLLICVAGAPKVYATEDGEKTESEAVAYFQTTGKPPIQTNGKWFTDQASSDNFGAKLSQQYIAKKTAEAVAGGYDITINGTRYGHPKAIAEAIRRDADSASGHDSNVSDMKIALAEMARVRAKMRQDSEQAQREEGLSDEQKLKLRAQLARNEKVADESEENVKELFQKPLPAPTYPPVVYRMLGVGGTESPMPTAVVGQPTQSAPAKALVSRGDNS